MKISFPSAVITVLGLLPLAANAQQSAHSTTVAQTTLPASMSVGASTAEIEEYTPPRPLDPRFYARGGLGGMESTSSSYRE